MVESATDREARLWALAALAAHTGWGAYPVLARYLQTVSRLPALSLLAFGNLIALAIAASFLIPRLERRVFAQPILWLFALIVVLRAVTNLFAARYTLSIYVQLVTQLTPFIVALLSVGVLGEKLPRYTVPALLLSVVGAALMVSGDIGQVSAFRQDWLGLGLALASSMALAVYMLVVRRTVTRRVPAEAVYLVQLSAIVVIVGPLALMAEDWRPAFQAATPRDWILFILFACGVFLGANLAQIGALRHIGAPRVSTMMAWRLISGLIFGALLLGERLDSWWQPAGAALVLITVTWYLWQQRRPTG